MTERVSDPSEDRLGQTLAFIAAIWFTSDLGYYFVLPMLGVRPSYNAGSVAIALYYIFWIGIAIITFWDIYVRWAKFDNRLASYAVWSLSFGGCTLFAAFVLPLMPPTNWTQSFTPPDVAVRRNGISFPSLPIFCFSSY
jgi:hypothetical protein